MRGRRTPRGRHEEGREQFELSTAYGEAMGGGEGVGVDIDIAMYPSFYHVATPHHRGILVGDRLRRGGVGLWTSRQFGLLLGKGKEIKQTSPACSPRWHSGGGGGDWRVVVWLGPMRELCTRRRMTGTNGEGEAGQGELGWEGGREGGWCWRLTEARPDM